MRYAFIRAEKANNPVLRCAVFYKSQSLASTPGRSEGRLRAAAAGVN